MKAPNVLFALVLLACFAIVIGIAYQGALRRAYEEGQNDGWLYGLNHCDTAKSANTQ